MKYFLMFLAFFLAGCDSSYHAGYFEGCVETLHAIAGRRGVTYDFQQLIEFCKVQTERKEAK